MTSALKGVMEKSRQSKWRELYSIDKSVPNVDKGERGY